MQLPIYFYNKFHKSFKYIKIMEKPPDIMSRFLKKHLSFRYSIFLNKRDVKLKFNNGLCQSLEYIHYKKFTKTYLQIQE
jgi:hypothetical protein